MTKTTSPEHVQAISADGSINEAWMNQAREREPLMTQIMSYFLSGTKIKAEITCKCRPCVMPTRYHSNIDTETLKTEYQPMIFCYFCNRTYHTGCMNLDDALLIAEKAPWMCTECQNDLHNCHAESYYRETRYTSKIITRRNKLLSVKENEKSLMESTFDIEDINSFRKRALEVLLEDDPTIDGATDNDTVMLQKAMKNRKERSNLESKAELYRANLEQAEEVIKQLRNQLKVSTQPFSFNPNINHHSVWPQHKASSNLPDPDHTVSFMGAQHSSAIQQPNQTLTQFYTAKGQAALNESNTFTYNPQRIEKTNLSGQSQVNAETRGNGSSNVDADLTTLVTRLTSAQERTEDRHLLEARRRANPKMTEFDGDDNKWLNFKQDVERYRINCQYDDETVKLYVRGALKGDAHTLVKDIFDTASLKVIMQILKSAYGDEMRMVRRRSDELSAFKFNAILYKTDAVRLQAVIQSYFAACNYAGTGYLNTNSLGETIFNQFNVEDRQRCKEYFRNTHPLSDTIVMDVQTVYDYLIHRMPLLDEPPIKKERAEERNQKKPYQVNAVSAPSHVNDSFKFEIRDNLKAPYIGYDINKVNSLPKKCLICLSRDHFAVQCETFKASSEEKRWKLCIEKHLCRCCLLTDAHTALNCELKSSCGYKVDQNLRCSGKHHVAIHFAAKNQQATRSGGIGNGNGFRRKKPNTNSNTERARVKIEVSKEESQSSMSTTPLRTEESQDVGYHAIDSGEGSAYKVYHINNRTPRSVKVFKVTFYGPKGRVDALVIGDSGSEVSLIRDDLREALGVTGSTRVLNLRWADTSTRSCTATQIDIQLKGFHKGAEMQSLKECYAVNTLDLPPRSLDMDILRRRYPNLGRVPFDSYLNEKPVMLIGSPHAALIEGCEMIDNGTHGPVALKTKIGWTVYGGSDHYVSASGEASVQSIVAEENTTEYSESCEEIETLENDTSCAVGKVSNEDLSRMLAEHFSIEALGIKKVDAHFTRDEQKAIDLMLEEMRVLDSGYVETPLLWNKTDGEIPKLPNNRNLVVQRQLAQEQKWRNNPLHLKAYNDNVKALLEQGFLREATSSDMENKWPNVWYLPMTLVINANKNPPKYRNVFDASSVYKNKSLNGSLLKGPDLLINILKPLIRMRMNHIAFTADVKSMFNMVWISPRDQQCQRVLWRENAEEPFKTYVSNVMLFGPSCSPFVSQFVKNRTAENWKEKFPEAADTLVQYTYMDDVLTSEPTLEKAIGVAKNCIEICDSIKWKLVAFQSNSIELLRALPETAIKSEAIPLLESKEENYVAKVLGCFWNTTDDCFEFKLETNLFIQLVNEFDQKPTKRDQASTIARIYDPLGLIAHFSIRGKILLQRSWVNKTGWNQEVDDDVVKEWKLWLSQIKDISKLQIPRKFTCLGSLNEADEVQLHIFCDAGNEAYGAVAYLLTKKNGSIEIALAMAKAKVTPLRLKTGTLVKEMPRLELLAALLAARIAKTLSTALRDVHIKRCLWSDSEVVLRWILNPNQKLIKYAIAPVEEILENTERSEWNYVPTKLNVADICTKLKNFDFSDNESVWFTGPYFLRQSEENWPRIPEKFKTDDSSMANNIYLEKLNYSTHELPDVNCTFANDSAIERFNNATKASWPKLIRATARALKLHMDGFAPLVRAKQWSNAVVRKELNKLTDGFNNLTPKDLERAEHFIFRKIQREEFPNEYKLLSQGKAIKNVVMMQLNVFIDHEGIIRINSRVNLNELSYPQQFVPLLPRKSPYVRLFLMYFHQKYKHITVESQIAEIRTRAWIPQLRTELKSIKAKCQTCRFMNAQPYNPPMASLPDYRISPDYKPFETVGLDALGPITLICNGKLKKVWILIFTCTLTRFIHLHILDSLESLRVLEAIVVFYSAHGPVRKFISDNGTNFKGAARVLREEVENARIIKNLSTKITPKLAEIYQVEWQFIPAHSPWFGGMYERLIKEVKRALRDTLQNRKTSKIELNIGVHEAAHRINCRPLTENSIDADNGEILTPHHLAKFRAGWPLLPGMHKNQYEQANEKSIYRRGRILADNIMSKFTAAYLPILTKKTKWNVNKSPVAKKGDLVLLIAPNQTRREWVRGKIIKLHAGRDGHVRVADVEMPNGEIKKNRALRNLAKIDVSVSEVGKTDENRDGYASFSINTIFEVSSVQNKTEESNSDELLANSNTNFENSNYEYRKKNSFVDNKMEKKKFQIQVAMIDKVPSDINLSTIVKILNNVHRRIVGIARQMDYNKNIAGEKVFIYFVEKYSRPSAFVGAQIQIEEQDYTIRDPRLIVGSAQLPRDYITMSVSELGGIPQPVAILQLRPLYEVTTFYLYAILKTIEKNIRVSGVKLCINEEKGMTRPFGFLFLMNRDEACMVFLREITVVNDVILLKPANAISLLIHEQDQDLLDVKGHALDFASIRDANHLCFDSKSDVLISTGSSTFNQTESLTIQADCSSNDNSRRIVQLSKSPALDQEKPAKRIMKSVIVKVQNQCVKTSDKAQTSSDKTDLKRHKRRRRVDAKSSSNGRTKKGYTPKRIKRGVKEGKIEENISGSEKNAIPASVAELTELIKKKELASKAERTQPIQKIISRRKSNDSTLSLEAGEEFSDEENSIKHVVLPKKIIVHSVEILNEPSEYVTMTFERSVMFSAFMHSLSIFWHLVEIFAFIRDDAECVAYLKMRSCFDADQFKGLNIGSPNCKTLYLGRQRGERELSRVSSMKPLAEDAGKLVHIKTETGSVLQIK